MICEFHRTGRMVRGIVACRHCGVAIEYCPCVGPHFRSVDHDCNACHGSMWVAIVRGNRAKIAEVMMMDA